MRDPLSCIGCSYLAIDRPDLAEHIDINRHNHGRQALIYAALNHPVRFARWNDENDREFTARAIENALAGTHHAGNHAED